MDAINRAYRNADIRRWQEMDFVVGYEIRRSNNPSKGCTVCARLAGKYPKSFLWDGWHDKCKCYLTSVLMDEETHSENRIGQFKSALYGTKCEMLKAVNEVRYVPKGFVDWFLENRQSFNETNTMPDFVTANIKLIVSSYEYYKNQNPRE